MPIIEGQALASGRRTGGSGVLVRGIRGPDLLGMQKISGSVEDSGGLLDFDNSGGVAIGTGLAQSLGVTVGDKVTLISPRGAITPFGTLAAGQVLSGRRASSRSACRNTIRPMSSCRSRRRSSISTARTRRRRSRSISTTPTRSARSAPPVEEAAKRPVFTTDWRMRNVTFFNALQVERNVMFMILTLIVLVAALNIISGLIMLVKDKGRDIAILRTMGATKGAILRVFFITGAAIGTVGTLVGLADRHDHLRQHRVAAASSSPGSRSTEVFSPELYFLSTLPAEMDPRETTAIVAHGARALLSRDALSGLAGGAARSGRGAALRMSEERSPRGRRPKARRLAGRR